MSGIPAAGPINKIVAHISANVTIKPSDPANMGEGVTAAFDVATDNGSKIKVTVVGDSELHILSDYPEAKAVPAAMLPSAAATPPLTSSSQSAQHVVVNGDGGINCGQIGGGAPKSVRVSGSGGINLGYIAGGNVTMTHVDCRGGGAPKTTSAAFSSSHSDTKSGHGAVTTETKADRKDAVGARTAWQIDRSFEIKQVELNGSGILSLHVPYAADCIVKACDTATADLYPSSPTKEEEATLNHLVALAMQESTICVEKGINLRRLTANTTSYAVVKLDCANQVENATVNCTGGSSISGIFVTSSVTGTISEGCTLYGSIRRCGNDSIVRRAGASVLLSLIA